jgi:hypothetical protein
MVVLCVCAPQPVRITLALLNRSVYTLSGLLSVHVLYMGSVAARFANLLRLLAYTFALSVCHISLVPKRTETWLVPSTYPATMYSDVELSILSILSTHRRTHFRK